MSSPTNKRVSLRNKKNGAPPLLVDFSVVADRSGSMHTMGSTPIKKLKELFADQAKVSAETNGTIRISFISFDNIAETYFDNVDVKEMLTITDEKWELMMSPRNTTLLIDTVWECAENQEKRVKEYKDSLSAPVKALNPVIKSVLVVLTDGQDNQSSKHTSTDLNIKLSELRNNGLNAIFLAANQDAMVTGENYGFSMDTSLTIGSDPTTSARGMGYVNNMCRGISSGAPTNIQRFSSMERQTSVPQNHQISPSQPPPPPLMNQGLQRVSNTFDYLNLTHMQVPHVVIGAPQPLNIMSPPPSPLPPPPETTPISSHVSPMSLLSPPDFPNDE